MYPSSTGMGVSAAAPSQTMYVFIWLFICIPYLSFNKLVNISKFFPEFCKLF